MHLRAKNCLATSLMYRARAPPLLSAASASMTTTTGTFLRSSDVTRGDAPCAVMKQLTASASSCVLGPRPTAQTAVTPSAVAAVVQQALSQHMHYYNCQYCCKVLPTLWFTNISNQ